MSHKRLLQQVTSLVIIGMIFGLFTTEAVARQRMSFRPGDRSRPAYHHGRSSHSARSTRHVRGQHEAHGSRSQPSRAGRRRGSGDSESEGAGSAKPGAGFTMDNGVLTYPAPERFQPRNLPHR